MPPRKRNAAETRETMLACARRRFLAESYENVGLRDIARDAGVDVALVGRYFGSKAQLFQQVLRGKGDVWLEQADSAEDLPSLLAELALDHGSPQQCERIERLLIILHSASSPEAAKLVRTAFRQDVLVPLASLLEGPQAQSRANLALSILLGTRIVNIITDVPPSKARDGALFRDQLQRVLGIALGQ
jgi:AcrR family transcriptional regulator